MSVSEINFDGIVGPTHNYAGLSYGNVASMKHRQAVSNPRQAALQGLAKMRFMMSIGIRQAVLPPHERPHLPTLRSLGYSGTDAQVLENAASDDPALLAAVCSSSNMWTANAATVSPSADCSDGRVHFTPANLVTQFHRSIEPEQTTRTLRTIFADESRFVVHNPLAACPHFADEGAANHSRLVASQDDPGVEMFVYGCVGFDPADAGPKKFPARQTLEACRAIARVHQLSPHRTLFVRQNPAAIDVGAFHNDVVSVAHRDVLLAHGAAFADRKLVEEWCIANAVRQIWIEDSEVSLGEAVATYLFNSQLVTRPGGQIALVAPVECGENPRVRDTIDRVIAARLGIDEAHFVDVRQSMHNGGGPACLRLRVALSDTEIAALQQGVLVTASLLTELEAWVNHHYRERLESSDLADPKLLDESRTALDRLTGILGLGSIYPFQG